MIGALATWNEMSDVNAAATTDASAATDGPSGEPSQDSDAPLLARFRDGDSRAFDELVRRYRRSTWQLAMRYLRSEHDADDVAQRAFVRAFEKLSLFRGDASFRTWLYRITVNLALNHLRDHARERPRPIAETALVSDGSEVFEGAGGADARRRARRLRECVAELPPKQRLVVELRIFEELPFREVAAIAECSEDSAKANFHHALKRLRESMAQPKESP